MSRKPKVSWRIEGKKARMSGKNGILWQAIDGSGEVLDFFFTETADEAAARRFFEKMLGRP